MFHCSWDGLQKSPAPQEEAVHLGNRAFAQQAFLWPKSKEGVYSFGEWDALILLDLDQREVKPVARLQPTTGVMSHIWKICKRQKIKIQKILFLIYNLPLILNICILLSQLGVQYLVNNPLPQNRKSQ